MVILRRWPKKLLTKPSECYERDDTQLLNIELRGVPEHPDWDNWELFISACANSKQLKKDNDLKTIIRPVETDEPKLYMRRTHTCELRVVWCQARGPSANVPTRSRAILCRLITYSMATALKVAR